MAEKMSAEALERALQVITYWGEGSPYETVVKQLEDHIAALQSEADRLRGALEPFAREAASWDSGDEDVTPRYEDAFPIDRFREGRLVVGDLRRARAALGATQQDATQEE